MEFAQQEECKEDADSPVVKADHEFFRSSLPEAAIVLLSREYTTVVIMCVQHT